MRFDWKQRLVVPKSGMKNQINGLYPIIRRVRRPLVPPDQVPVGTAGAKPEVPVSQGSVGVTEASNRKGSGKDGKGSSNKPAE